MTTTETPKDPACFDLAQLDTAARAEAGADMAVCHPVTGERLTAGDGYARHTPSCRA